MSAEYTLMRRQGAAGGKGSTTAYAAASAAVEVARAEDFLLSEIEARTEQLLESRQKIERAKRALADARAALVQGAWNDGTLTDKVNLADAVSGLLAPA